MSLLGSILTYNQSFVEKKAYKPFQTSKFPDQKMVVLTCMDTRLSQLLPHAMNIKNGDAKIIKNAGAVITHPYGSIMRSIIVALYELKVKEVYIVGHHGCGMAGLQAESVLEKAKKHGVSEEALERLLAQGIDVNQFLSGFDKVEDSVKHSANVVRTHPLIPHDVPVHALVICPKTGKLDVVENGYDIVQAAKPSQQ
ncbi:carbonic anhydrase [Halalkalibacterium halodurans]|uniref:beta-class carbonic anhydrase n=1 Tax=Halalkalibacterium halodurans TaxID=86665 RepID=UPI002E23B448|nr:carbonic anhydrase [Halalkalibacterium halodurans]